jgi:serine/threonine protein phosphatase PrpC
MWETVKVLEAWASRLEDRAEVFRAGDSVVVVLADGAGGRPGAAYTAETTVRLVGEAVPDNPPRWDPLAWCNLLRRIDEALAHDPAAGETTAVVAVLSPDGVLGASVGDSGAWLVTPDGIQDLTARQRRKPFLGTGAAVPVPFAAPPTAGTLLVASDGLFKYADRLPIAAAARGEDLPSAARRLVDLVRLPSGKLQDDVAVVLGRPAGPLPPLNGRAPGSSRW